MPTGQKMVQDEQNSAAPIPPGIDGRQTAPGASSDQTVAAPACPRVALFAPLPAVHAHLGNLLAEISGYAVTQADSAAHLRALAGGAGSERNVGGMVTKLLAAEIAAEGGVDTIIASGRREKVLLELADGKKLGTRFSLKKK